MLRHTTDHLGEKQSYAEDLPALRKRVDTKTKRVVEQVRGPVGSTELVSVAQTGGKERLVRVPREELQAAQERADRDFDRAVAAVTAGEEIDRKMFGDLMRTNKESILALAGKEGDVKGAVYKIMEDAVEALKAYDRQVNNAVADSGYSGIVADGLRHTLLEQRSTLFGEALAQSAGVRAKRPLENAMRAKLLAEASKQIAALEETVGEPEPEVVDTTAHIVGEIARLETLTDPVESNRLDRRIQKETTEWVRSYLAENPDTTDEQILSQVDALGMGDFITLKDVHKINTDERVRRMSHLESAEDLPADVPDDEWSQRDTEPATTMTRTRARRASETFVPETGETLVPTADKTAQKKGFMQGLAKGGRRMLLGLALMLGIRAGAPDQKLPHQEGMVAAPEGQVTAVTEEMEVEQATEPTKQQVEAKRLVRKAGDPKNLEDALNTLSVLPGKAEFQTMQRQEKVAQQRAALEDFKVIRSVLSQPNPGIDAARMQTLKTKLEDTQSRWELMKTIREL